MDCRRPGCGWALLAGVFVASPVAQAGDIEAGRQKASACITCHDSQGRGTLPMYPNLGGQSAFYLAKQLTEFRSGKRADQVMAVIAAPLSDQDIEDLSAYYESLDGACPCP